MEVFSEPGLADGTAGLPAQMAEAWRHFVPLAREAGVFDTLGLNPDQHALELEVFLVGDTAMQALNRDYRGKDTPTDVLTFTLLADAPDRGHWLSLPVLQLGSIFLSVPWAERHGEPGQRDRFLLERFVHGLLHLLGQHHDTMPDYERVVGLQHAVLALMGEAT